MPNPKPAATNDEPQLAREEDVAVDRKDDQAEEEMKKVRNDKLRDGQSPDAAHKSQ